MSKFKVYLLLIAKKGQIVDGSINFSDKITMKFLDHHSMGKHQRNDLILPRMLILV
jgi:hypothetical protein